MYHRPFLDQVQSPTRQLTLKDRRCPDIDGGFELAIAGVKVWRGVVVVEHTDQDPIKGADRRHLVSRFYHRLSMTAGNWLPSSLHVVKLTPPIADI
jgi:hypothetical protein